VYRREKAAAGVTRNRIFTTIACENCGRECSAESGSPQRFCSLTCSQNARYGHKISRCTELEVYTGPPFVRKSKINKNPIPKRVGTFKSGNCRVCLSSFVTLNRDVTCSVKCQSLHDAAVKKQNRKSPTARAARKRSKDRRRALMHGAFVEDVDLFVVVEMDDGICIICDEPVDLQASAPNPDSPTIEHYIPLNRGGEHSYANCGLAHFLCNSRKSAMTPDEYRSWAEAVPA
jgi:5-methylcytosine-specific restriction endonuclease McrA